MSPHIYPAQLTPLSNAYSMPGMLSYPDRARLHMPVWVRQQQCPPDATLRYLLTTLYPGGTTQ